MSEKGKPRNTIRITKRDKAMISFLQEIYPKVNKYKYAYMKCVEGEDVHQIYMMEKPAAKERSIRRYIEMVTGEIKNNKSKKYKTLEIKKGAKIKELLDIFLNQYADTGRFLPEARDWTTDILFQVLEERVERAIFIEYDGSIFAIKGIRASKSDCQNAIESYINNQKSGLKWERGTRYCYLKLEKKENLEPDEKFIGKNLLFKRYNAIFFTFGQKKPYSLEIKLPVYMKAYGKASVYRKNKYYPQKYPLTALDLEDKRLEECVYYRNQWEELISKLRKKIYGTIRVGNCKPQELAAEYGISTATDEYLYLRFGKDIVAILDNTVRNAKLVKEYKNVFKKMV